MTNESKRAFTNFSITCKDAEAFNKAYEPFKGFIKKQAFFSLVLRNGIAGAVNEASVLTSSVSSN